MDSIPPPPQIVCLFRSKCGTLGFSEPPAITPFLNVLDHSMLLETQAVYCQVAASKQQGTAPAIAGSSVKPSSVSQAEGAPFTSPGYYFFSKAAAWGVRRRELDLGGALKLNHSKFWQCSHSLVNSKIPNNSLFQLTALPPAKQVSQEDP